MVGTHLTQERLKSLLALCFSARGLNFCAAFNDRFNLINSYGWTITEDGIDDSCESSFTSTWLTSTNNESITIPTTGGGYDYTVDWGDGTVESGFTGNATHIYATSGNHTVSILGSFPRIFFDDTGDKNKILSVQNWGDQVWTSMQRAFAGCQNLQVAAADTPDLSAVFSTAGMFRDASNLNSSNLVSWDVSNVTNMTDMFRGATAFNQDIGIWDVSNLQFMFRMFLDAASFNQNLSNWDLSSINVNIVAEPIDIILATTAMSVANYDATLIGWAEDSSGSPADGIDDIPQNLVLDATGLQYCLASVARESLIEFEQWTITGDMKVCNIPEGTFTTIWQTDAIGAENDQQIIIPTTGDGYNYLVYWHEVNDESNVFAAGPFIGDATIDLPVAGSYKVFISGDFPRIFFNDSGDNAKLLSIEQWGDQVWTSMAGAFAGCINLQISATDSPDLTQVTDMSNMFLSCASIMEGNFNSWDVSNVENMSGLFQSAVLFNSPLNNWDVGQVKNMASMFQATNVFNQPLDTWDVSNVEFMFGTFAGAFEFNQDLSNWDVAQVTEMDFMFASAREFNQSLGNWDISSVSSMPAMLLSSGLSTENYDNTLIGWATLDESGGETQIPMNIELGANGLTYCLSALERQSLIDDFGWTITDAGGVSGCLRPFVIEMQTTEASEEVTIRTNALYNYNFTIDWGDGTVESDQTSDATHTYAVPGVYQVRINGEFPRPVFNDELRLQKVLQWGDIAWQDFTNAFNGCRNMVLLAADAPDLSNVSSLKNAFENNQIGLWPMNAMLNWNVSTISTMEALFRYDVGSGNDAINLDLSNWDVSNVTDMSFMFSAPSVTDDRQVNIIGLENWDVSNVTNMRSQFQAVALSFNADITNWDVSNVTNMSSMFAFSAFLGTGGDISGWNVGNVTNMSNMFREASAVDALQSWDVSNVTNMTGMFSLAANFDQDLSTWDVSNVTDMTNMFDGSNLSTTNYDAILIAWSQLPSVQNNVNLGAPQTQYCALEAEQRRQLLIDQYGWNITDAGRSTDNACLKAFVTTWQTTAANESITIPTTGGGYNYDIDWGDGTVQTGLTGNATHSYATPGTYQVSIRGAFPRIYFNTNNSIENKILSVDQWGEIQWTSMERAFDGCSNLTIPASDAPDLSQVTNMNLMFRNASSLTTVPAMNLWDVSNVESMVGVFANATLFNGDVSNWDVSNCTDMRDMFAFTEVFNRDISGWDVGNVTNMNNMFQRATAFNQDIGNWDVSMVERIFFMFDRATSFNQDLGAWDISSLTLGIDNAFFESGLSTANYDALLIGWSTLDPGETQIPENLIFLANTLTYCAGADARADLVNTYGWNITGDSQATDCGIQLRLKAFLQGPYNSGNGLQNDDLRTATPTNLIPSTEPYTALNGFTHVDGGGETVAQSVLQVTGNDAIVDWVFLELRDPSDSTIVLYTRSALLQRDGDIVEVTGGSDPVQFSGAAPGDYFVVVRHRNHLGVMTKEPVPLN